MTIDASAPSDREILDAMPEIGAIGDSALRADVLEYWRRAYAQSAWAGVTPLGEVPYNTKISGTTLVRHSEAVARIAASIADESLAHGIACDRDDVIAGSILHDACKLLEMDPDPDDGRRAIVSELGAQLAHGVVGGYLARDLGMSLAIQHIIVTHTPQSGMSPKTMDARTVRIADIADANLHFSGAGLGDHIRV